MINIALMTVDRPKNYVHKLVGYLRKDLPVRLVVGSPSYGYLERYRRNPNIEIIGVDAAGWNWIKGYPVAHRASWNYWRCFVHGIKPGDRNGLLILEDDVMPAKGWEKRLCETVEQVESQFGQEFVLALYTAYTKLAKPVARGLYTRYPISTFANTQAMYYPEPVRAAFAEYLRAEGVESFHTPYDMLLAEYLRLTGIPLLVTTPCLFQHIGEVSTGLSPSFHNAGHFSKVPSPKP